MTQLLGNRKDSEMAKRGLRKEVAIDEAVDIPLNEVVEEIAEPVKEVVKEPVKNRRFGFVSNCVTLNLRSGASTNDSVICELTANTNVEITEDVGDFHKVIAPNNKVGYVMKNYITETTK